MSSLACSSAHRHVDALFLFFLELLLTAFNNYRVHPLYSTALLFSRTAVRVPASVMSELSEPHGSTTYFVVGIPSTASDLDLRSTFSSYGRVTHVKMGQMRGKPNGTAQVRFRSPVKEQQSERTITLKDHKLCVRLLPAPTVAALPQTISPSNPFIAASSPFSFAQAAAAPPQGINSFSNPFGLFNSPFAQPSPVPTTAAAANGGQEAVFIPNPFLPAAAQAPVAKNLAATAAPDKCEERLDDEFPPLPDSFCESDSDTHDS